jgi:hypothetical protein
MVDHLGCLRTKVNTTRLLVTYPAHAHDSSNWRSRPNLEIQSLARQHKCVAASATTSWKGASRRELTAIRSSKTIAADRWHGALLGRVPQKKNYRFPAIQH